MRTGLGVLRWVVAWSVVLMVEGWRRQVGGCTVGGSKRRGLADGGLGLGVCCWRYAVGGLGLGVCGWGFAVGGMRLGVWLPVGGSSAGASCKNTRIRIRPKNVFPNSASPYKFTRTHISKHLHQNIPMKTHSPKQRASKTNTIKHTQTYKNHFPFHLP